MIKKKAIYRCEKCGNIIESLWDGNPPIICCDQPMKELVANTTDAAQEKHVPVIQREGDKVTVKIGSVAHPMTAEHYILFIEVLDGDNIYRKDLTINDAPEASFMVKNAKIIARAFCNLHGLWQKEEE